MSTPYELADRYFSDSQEDPTIPSSTIGIPPSEMHGEKRDWTVITRPDGTATMSTFDASKYVFYKQNPKQNFSLLVPREKFGRYEGSSVVEGCYGKEVANNEPWHTVDEVPVGCCLLIKKFFEDIDGKVVIIATDGTQWCSPPFFDLWFQRMTSGRMPKVSGEQHKVAIYRKTETTFSIRVWDKTKTLTQVRVKENNKDN